MKEKITIILIVGLMAFFLSSSPAIAHPGNTASDGCHYCRTRCDYWGVPWNERHCHGGGVVAPVETQPVIPQNQAPAVQPSPSPVIQLVKPSPSPSRKPKPSPKPSPSPSPSLSPSPSPSLESSPSPELSPSPLPSPSGVIENTKKPSFWERIFGKKNNQQKSKKSFWRLLFFGK